MAGCFTSTVIPSLVRLRAQGLNIAAMRLARTTLTGIVIVLGSLAILLGLCGYWLLAALGSSFSPEKLRLAYWLFLSLLIWLPFSGCIATWRAVLNAHDSFALPASAPIATPLMTIAALYLFVPKWGIFALSVGTVLGVATEVLVLACAVRALGYRIALAWDGYTPEIASIFRQYLPLVVASMVSSAAVVVDQAVAGMLGSGSVAELAYANKLVSVFLAIAAAALSTSVLPVFSRLAALRDWRSLRRIVITYSVAALAISLPITAVLFAWSEPIVRTFYQHGAFRSSATQVVATVQRFALLQVPFAIVLALLMKVVIAVSANVLLARVALAGFIVNLVCDVAFAHWIGIAGIALASAVVQFLSVVTFAIVLGRRFSAAEAASSA